MNKKTALLVVDMVYDFAHPDGLVYYPQNEAILPKIKQLLDVTRKHDVLNIFVADSHREHKYDKELTMVRKHCLAGTGGDELMDSLEFDEVKEFKINKRRYSSFYGTDLDLILREHRVENTIIVGTKTNCCIRSTVHDAYYLNYNVFVVRDCVATNDDVVNEVHLTDIDKYYGTVLSLDETIKMINSGDL